MIQTTSTTCPVQRGSYHAHEETSTESRSGELDVSLPAASHFKVADKLPVWYRVMDQAIGRHLVHSVLEALRDFARIKELSLHHSRYDGDICYDYQSVIHIQGIPEWLIVVDIERTLIEDIVCNLLGVTETDEDIIQDLTNELANLVAGGFKTYLPCFTKLGLPKRKDPSFSVKDHASQFPLWKISCATPHGVMNVYTAPLMLKHD